MSNSYGSIAFTEPVQRSQVAYGSRAAMDHAFGAQTADPAPRDPLGEMEQSYLAGRDGFHLATVSESGWPYVQFRGGPPGFVTCPDEHTLAWADFRGNRQYISTGNIAHDARVALIFMDYARQLRLKVFGVATISDVRGRDRDSDSLGVPGYRAIIEREVRIDVTAFDWNCPQHITPRYSAKELASVLEPLQRRITDLEMQNQRLRRHTTTSPSAREAGPSGPGPTEEDT